MFKSIFTIFFLCFSCIVFSQAKTYKFKHVSTAEGLSQSSVITICQDRMGQVWIGTRDGLNKYDGNSLSIYRNEVNNEASISNNDILSIEQDREGFIWVGTYNGLNRYNPKTNSFKRYFHEKNASSLTNNTVWAIKELSNGELWVGTSEGLSVYQKKTDAFTSVLKTNASNSIAGNRIRSILETSNGTVYIGTTSGLSEFSSLKNETYQFKTIANSENLFIQDVIETNEKNILIATKANGIFEYNPATESLQNFFNDTQLANANKNVRKLLFDDSGNLWAGTYNGIQIIDAKKQITTIQAEISDPESLSKNSVKSLYKDNKGSIWIGTYYGGINLWDEANVNFINYKSLGKNIGLSYDVVSSIEQYENEVYFGTEGGGITVLERNQNKYSYINTDNSDLPDNNIKSLYLSEDKNLWIGTFSEGVAVYDIDKKQFNAVVISEELKTYLANVGIYAIKKDKFGNIWLGTFGKGLVAYNVESKTFKTYRHQQNNAVYLSSDLVRNIHIDSNENVWVATERGLNKIDANSTITTYFYDAQLESGDDMLSLFEDADNTIWVGTKAKGLFKFTDTAFVPVDISLNTTNQPTIHSILQDAQKKLWISTNQGLLRYDIDSGAKKVFNSEQGIVGNEFNDNASLQVSNSEFYFGGPNGVTYFDSSKLIQNQYVPQVLITDFKLKNKSVNVHDDHSILQKTIGFTDEIALDYDQGNFSISFAIPNFINSNNNAYKYRLKGLEEDWIYTSDNTTTYTIQKPGDYIFEVKGANSDELWNETATNIHITVAPAPWKSWWAFSLYGLLIFAALYYLIFILKSRTRLQTQLELEYLEVERTKDINKAKLEFFTNISHEFRTPLTLILGPLQQILEDYRGSSMMYKKLMVVESSAKHLLQLINRLMDFRKFENNLYTLEAAEGNIVKFLKEIYLSFSEYANDGDYDYNFHTTEDEILVYYDRYKLERVFYNLISNAFRYTPKEGKIAIRIKQENNHIIINIEDSGVGIAEEYQDKIFERFYEVSINNNPDKTYNKGTGIGLSIAKNIVDLHKGKLTVSNNSEGQGSVFSVELPLGNAHLSEDEIIKDFKFSDDVSQYVQQLKEPNIIVEDDILDTVVEKEKPTVLIVEDNKPLRKFMFNLLKDQYNVLEAENGKNALKIAQKQSPNLIISDVIMPVMVGTELCAAIKSDIKTSHIPVILLTSRSSLIYRLEGLESGADDYISKPFNLEEFKLRIKNLLESTLRLKEKYISNDALQPNEVIVSSLDEKLYKKALKIVEDNISNEQFDIPYFCSELGVSRTMLFVKVKAWTNFTPNEFIQHFRMKRAAQLLEQGKINISEVSYKVGFKNPKYFSKCFQKKYGETPTKYSNRFSVDD